jgi:hypothetical protein
MALQKIYAGLQKNCLAYLIQFGPNLAWPETELLVKPPVFVLFANILSAKYAV